jgi:hypothetical protein
MEQSLDSSMSLAAAPKRGQAPKVVLVHQDLAAQQHAMGFWDRVTQLVGNEAAACASWSVAQLSQPQVFDQAVAAAVQAEVIVVAVQSANMLPPAFGAWIESWRGLRRRREGALIAVLGLPAQPGASSDCVQEYLRAIARKSGMDFTLLEHATPPMCGCRGLAIFNKP